MYNDSNFCDCDIVTNIFIEMKNNTKTELKEAIFFFLKLTIIGAVALAVAYITK